MDIVTENVTGESSSVPDESSEDKARHFMQAHAVQSLDMISGGIEGWTVDARMRYMRGLCALVRVISDQTEHHLPRVLSSLTGAIRDTVRTPQNRRIIRII